MWLQSWKARFLQSHLHSHSLAGQPAPPRDSNTSHPTSLFLPHPRALHAGPRVGVRYGLCLEADVIATPYSAVFPEGPQGRFS
ncbi:mCG148491 [Mus musculus]|nr:mCG148491 [Mus musculus]